MLIRAHVTRTAFAALAVLPIATAGCIEMDVSTKLEADGSGTMSMNGGLTSGMVSIVRELEKLDPDDDTVKQTGSIVMTKPGEAELAKMKADGLELLEFETKDNETEMSTRLKAKFKTLAAMSAMESLSDGGGDDQMAPSAYSLTREDDGTYVLAMVNDSDDEEVAEELEDLTGGMGEDDDLGGDEEEDPAKAMQALALMGRMMAEMEKLSIKMALEVPGEVVSYSPETGAKKDGSRVQWSFDMQTMMAAQMEGDGNPMENGFSVRFRMPEGKSIPEAALTKSKTKTASGADTDGGETETEK